MSTITGTLSPNDIIGPTDISATLTVNLSSASPSSPTISIDPSYIAYLDGNMTSSDGGFTWNGSINRTPGMNLLGNTLTVSIGDISSNIAFDVLENENLRIEWIEGEYDNITVSTSSEKYAFAFSRDGKTFAYGGGRTGFTGNLVTIYKYINMSWNSYDIINTTGFFARAVSLSDDGSKLVVGAPDNYLNDRVFIYNLTDTNYTQLREYSFDNTVLSGNRYYKNMGRCVSISGNGNYIFFGNFYNHTNQNGKLYQIAWNASNGTQIVLNTIGNSTAAGRNTMNAEDVDCSEDGSIVIVGNNDPFYTYGASTKWGCVHVFKNGTLKNTFYGTANYDYYGPLVCCSPDGLKVAFTSPGKIHIKNLNSNGDLVSSKQINKDPSSMIFSNDNTKLFIASGNFCYTYEYDGSNWSEDVENRVDYTDAKFFYKTDNNLIQMYGQQDGILLRVYENIVIRQLSSQITLDPSNIEYPNTTSNFQINFTTNDNLNALTNLSLSSDAGYLDNVRLSNYGFRLEGEIKANGGYSNNSFITYNEFTPNETIEFSIEVPQSTYHITDSGKKIMYSPFSRSAEDNQGKIEVFNSSGNIEHTFIDDVVGSVYVNQEGNLIVIGLPKDDGKVKSYLFEDGSWNEHYNGNNEYISDSNLGELVHLSGNNELMVVNNTTASNYEVDIYKESVARYATYFETDVSSIIYPNNTLNFEVKLTTNDVLLADISANASNLFRVDPSYVGYIDAYSLSLSNYGFSLHGTFTVSGEYNEPNVKLFYNDFSSNIISLDSVQDLSINDFYFDYSFVTYLNQATNKITLELNRGDIDNIDVSNSLTLDPSNCGSITDVIDGTNSSIKKITFEPAYNFENSNCSLTFDYNKGLLDASQTILFSVNNYVPQITNITNDNSFNYIDTSGTILLEFDRNLLRDLSLNDLSYNETKLDLQLEKLSDSSYNILVDPTGEYAETQVITVKDLLGTDLSNISLEIDTIIPTFSEITLAPGALNYEVSGGILDVKFNKTLLDRDQLVLTSSSDISFTFLQQYDTQTSSTIIGNSMPVEPTLNNFTYTINGDASENIIKAALQKWDNIIVKHPIDKNNNNVEGTTKIHITFSVSDMDAGTLGYAYVDYVYFDDLNGNKMIDYSDNIYTSSGFIALSQASYNSMISETRTDGHTTLYYVLMHEIGHIIGIGPYFGHNNSPRVAYQEQGNDVTKYYYTGVNALAKYRMYMNDASLVGIPIEDDGGAGTVNVHPEEHRIEGKTRHIGGHPHEGLDEELMTGWTESGNTIMPLSAVSIGFLEDMGYDVSYAFADIYRNMDYNGNTDSTFSIKMGITMDTTLPVFPTYSVVQYEVKSNDYGLKSIQDISFNYRGNYDVSNIDIEVNTIIPDVSSIDIENILYSDTSGIVTITFNDHDGNYFYGKDASMNIYLDTSVNEFSTLVMETISDSSNVWQGVITTISGEFYPDAKLYLQHSGMDGLINVDVSANYRLDTDIRGLYITLPEMAPRTTNIPHSQTINYLTYDHNTNKLETDVSFQFNIDVSNNLEQFPYIDICENFIKITSTNLNPGAVELDKGIGFTGRFWNGILTISGEVDGTFDICYNETLNPLRSDGVIEIREDKLTVYVNTELPDISNVIVPSKLSYLDISGDVEIKFDKDILPGDENNIQIEYSLEDTNEYQFLDKYGDNTVSGVDLKYEFNSISYNANKKIALGIGTYTLNVSSIHPIFLTDNELKHISISGINTSNGSYGTGYHGIVTINVTGDFGTASYKCSSHGSMGGENRFIYKDVEVSPLAQNSATHWKYALSLPQEIDTSLNVTIKYRDETSEPHIIPIYGIVPDVSSVTLSSTDLTYNDPSCVVTVEFNNALQDRTNINIYDLISLEPSSELFIQGASFSSTDDRVWTGILDISNNVENEFAHIGAKVSVNGIQSAAFGQGISGESVFNIDTILPDVSNIIISKMGYSNKTSNFTIIFTKDDLNGYDISKSLSVPNTYFTIANVELINGNTLSGDIRTNYSGIEADVSFIIDYSFNYRNNTLTKQIYRATDFEVDTRERGIKTLLLTNDTDITNNGNSYLFTYLDNIGNLTLDFFTNDLSGIDVSSDMSFNSNINYSLSNSVINDTSLNTIMTVDMSQNAGPLTFTYGDSEDRTSFQNNIFIDTRPRYITDITFSKTELTYLDKQGTLTITFNHNIFEDVDVITNLLNYPSSDLSLNNATITGSDWSCNLLSISELDDSFDVSMVYNGQTHSLSTPIILDTIIPQIDTSDETDIGNTNITYKNRSTLVKITFTNDIESSSEITDTLKLEGVSDSSYSFVGSLDTTSKIEWNGRLTIDDWDISLSDVIIYSTYQGGTIINNNKLKIDINTKRPEITNSNISIDKNKFTYLEPSGTLTITFEGENVLDTSINSFISTGSAITVGSMSRTDNTWTGNISINQHDISENQVVNVSNYYGQNASISIPFMTILPRINTINNIVSDYTYLDLGLVREIVFVFSGEVLETDIMTFANNSISINNNDCSLNSFSRLTNNSIKANFIINQESEIDDLKINFDYYSEYYDVSINQEFALMNVDTRIPNIKEATDISNTYLTYDASSTQLDVYFDASLLDISASSVLDASLVTSFVSDPSINISQFIEINKRHYRANITTEYNIDKSEGNSVTVNYMDTSATLTFNVDTILRPYSNICFPRGEKVLTDNGYKNIEQIDIKLDTIRGEKIEELTQTQTQEKKLVLIKCGALMKNMPNKDTLITNNHKVMYKGNLVEAYKLVTLVESGVELVDYNGETLYNILLEGEKEGKMVVNGMIVETLSHTNNIARLYKKIRKYGTTEYKKKRMIELFNKNKK